MKCVLLGLGIGLAASIAAGADRANRADGELAAYFQTETARLSERCLDAAMLSDWKSRRGEYQRQLQEMLGLWPMPDRSDLNAVVTGKVEHDEFTVEKLHFQALPGLYVTANLYLPRNVNLPAPTILYECGHWRLVTNGVSYGNKAVYQIDGAWFARNGYTCMVLDTLLAGEIQGIHTGTRDHGLWWWNSRGYTPAGVEAWFGIRALDYLSTRPEVDTNRFGITGHSGGGAYSWMVMALDDRVKVAAPLAGMADIQAHIGSGVIDSHCDCNFVVNTYRWDFPQVAALAAPRPLLIGGTDKDRIFPLETTLRIHEKVRRVYQQYNAGDRLGLVIAPGPHDETPELRLAVMRWFDRHLKGQDTPVRHNAERLFAPEALKVFSSLPTDAINTNIAERIVLPIEPKPTSIEELQTELRRRVFSGWPGDTTRAVPQPVWSVERDGIAFRAWDFESQPGVRLRFYCLTRAGSEPRNVRFGVLGQAEWNRWLAGMRERFEPQLRDELAAPNRIAEESRPDPLTQLDVSDGLVFFAPRGVGLTQWSADGRGLTRIRRRFMLLGQTLDAMRVWDIRRAMEAFRGTAPGARAQIELWANDQMAVNVLYAALFEVTVPRLRLSGLPQSHLNGPDYLSILRITDIPEVTRLLERAAGHTERQR